MQVQPFAILLSIALLGPAGQAQAQIYKTTDEQGNVTFTDQPPADSRSSEPVELPPTNIVSPVSPRAAVPAPEPNDPNQVAAAQPLVSITAPADESTIPKGGGIFDVSAAVDRPLAGGQLLQLLVDGVPWGEPQPDGSWHLTDILRGPHDLTVELLDASGNPIASSASVRVYVLRPSIIR